VLLADGWVVGAVVADTSKKYSDGALEAVAIADLFGDPSWIDVLEAHACSTIVEDLHSTRWESLCD
jgi:hypothetical protein